MSSQDPPLHLRVPMAFPPPASTLMAQGDPRGRSPEWSLQPRHFLGTKTWARLDKNAPSPSDSSTRLHLQVQM